MSTYTTGSPRKGVSERITGVIWGAIVTAVGGLLIAALSGYDVDLELVAIVSLVALGGWLLASAIAAGTRQSRREHASVPSSFPPAPEPSRGPATGSAADGSPESGARD